MGVSQWGGGEAVRHVRCAMWDAELFPSPTLCPSLCTGVHADDEEALRRVAQVAEGVASLFSSTERQQDVDAFFGRFKVSRACRIPRFALFDGV